MFERFTEKARRVVFFARYEASQYGSPYIETEHFLLGLMREERSLMTRVLGPGVDPALIRTEVEKHITKGNRIASNAEVPLSDESKKILNFAVEHAEQLGQLYVGGEHFLLAILDIGGSLAAKVLAEKGVKPVAVRDLVATLETAETTRIRAKEEVTRHLHRFLAMFLSKDSQNLHRLFSGNPQIVDDEGKAWIGSEEVKQACQRLKAMYGTSLVTSSVDRIDALTRSAYVAILLWENLDAEGEERQSVHRMTLLFTKEQEEGGWVVSFMQVTPVARD